MLIDSSSKATAKATSYAILCCGAHMEVIDDVWPMSQSWQPLLSRDEIPERIL